jgi:NADPH:quinone reductase-like Zn-dependent oxidoreductase
MRADICAEYRWPDVLQLKELATPTPQDDEALVRMHALSVNAADLETLRGDLMVRMAAPRKPMHQILGTDIAGSVEAVGRNAKQLEPASLFALATGTLSEAGGLRCKTWSRTC